MKAPQANLLNAIVLIAAGIIGYFFIPTATGAKAPTALIPAAFGLLFLVLHKGVITSNKIIAHVVAVSTTTTCAIILLDVTTPLCSTKNNKPNAAGINAVGAFSPVGVSIKK